MGVKKKLPVHPQLAAVFHSVAVEVLELNRSCYYAWRKGHACQITDKHKTMKKQELDAQYGIAGNGFAPRPAIVRRAVRTPCERYYSTLIPYRRRPV